jgi:hypothetical protein
MATEVEASTPSRRAWVSIASGRESKLGEPVSPDAPLVFVVQRFEMDRETAASDGYFGNEDILDRVIFRTFNLKEAEAYLSEWVPDLSVIDVPWKCDYPL